MSQPKSAGVTSHHVVVEGVRLHYLGCGSGPPVLLLHGWPTSSFLWRNVLPAVGARSRAIALDLPGFGRSDKPLDASYSFRYHSRILGGFLEALGVDSLGLAVHDLGGPIGLYWACHHPARIRALALLNTVIYPQLSWAVVAFVAACRLPGARSLLASPWGLRQAMRVGLADPRRLTGEVMREYLAPFVTSDARRALLKAGAGLHPKGMEEIASLLPSLRMPVRIAYGARDRILPDVARTMRRAASDLPQAEVTEIPGCGHFLQEERPEEVGRILSDFFSRNAGPAARPSPSGHEDQGSITSRPGKA